MKNVTSRYLVYLNTSVLGIQLGILGGYSWKICDGVHLIILFNYVSPELRPRGL